LTINAITEFQRRKFADGRVDPGGQTLKALNDSASGKVSAPKSAPPPATDAGKKYTDHQNEMPAKKTTPTVREVVKFIGEAWDELNEHGVRTLAAQFMHETAEGKYCFNWNLGNKKSPGVDQPHMYLRNVWECYFPSDAQAQVDRSSGLARIATSEEKKKRGWSCPAGKIVVVFSPPHKECRFRAYESLENGAQRWVAHHRNITKDQDKYPNYLTHLNAGDVASVANTLKKARYYSGSESDYVRGMTAKKAVIDKHFEMA
jgi:hypothetical protein